MADHAGRETCRFWRHFKLKLLRVIFLLQLFFRTAAFFQAVCYLVYVKVKLLD
ncbi:hypothetical protein COCNU_scaffold018973G000060 [Cocos nucifera]|nr:hypothetical protein [Cocos nucifera]